METIDQNASKETVEGSACPHGKTANILAITVLGVECKLNNSPMCPDCTEKYLNEFSTLCAFCLQPIFPGTPVGRAKEGAPYPYTHLDTTCCISGGLFCGQWGEGRLITLDELNPENFSY